MASTNLGAVIQRAISDGAFRRQLQSDPAAALRGFNLTPDEVAAIRSADSSKLMSLGVDQRMSKAFTAGEAFTGTRAAVSDLNASTGATVISNDATAGTREGFIGDPGSTARDAVTLDSASATRAVHDSAPFGTPQSSAIEDPSSPEYAAAQDASVASRMADAGDATSIRAVHDVDPFEGNATAAAPSGEFLGDASIDPGTGSARTFLPSDSADQQREMMEDHGNALGNTGTDTGGEHNLS